MTAVCFRRRWEGADSFFLLIGQTLAFNDIENFCLSGRWRKVCYKRERLFESSQDAVLPLGHRRLW